jgi:drug/metabolite transporter (DMT)-like permease
VSRDAKAHILLILVTVVWGGTFLLIKLALSDVSPLLFNAIRMVLASMALGIIFRRRLSGLRQSLKPGITVGVFLFGGYEFQTSGLRFTTAAKSGFITGISVVLVPVISVILFRRRASIWTWIGVLLAFAGTYLMTIPAQGGFSLASINRGDLLTLVCAVCFALQIIAVGRATASTEGGHPFEHIAFLQAATAAVLMSISSPIFEHPHVTWSAMVIAAILITGLLGTAAAFSVQTWAQQFLPATHTALIFALEPVFAWLTSAVFAHEHLESRAVAGAAMILGGILLAEVVGATAERPLAA